MIRCIKFDASNYKNLMIKFDAFDDEIEGFDSHIRVI